MLQITIGAENSASEPYWIELAKVISELVGNIAWPSALIIVIIIYRREISNILRRLQSLTAPGLELRVSDELEKAQEIAEISAEVQPSQALITSTDDDSIKLEYSHPSLAIVDAYRQLEARIRALPSGDTTTARQYVHALRKLAIISRELLELFEQLRRTRNVMVHSNQTVTPDEALRYGELVRSLINALDKHKEEISEKNEDLRVIIFAPRPMYLR